MSEFKEWVLTGGVMTVEVFKEWYNAVYIGDGEIIDRIPTATDKNYSEYMSGYTLAYGAYLEGVKFAESQKYKVFSEQSKKIAELEYKLNNIS